MKRFRVVIVPDKGCMDVQASHLWYSWLQEELIKREVEAVLRVFPDWYDGHASEWLPFLRDELKCDSKTIVVGHAIGAVAALRLLEQGTQLAAVVLVSAYHSDLGDPGQKRTGFFDEPWHWEDIRRNTKLILQFHSVDDPLVPVDEARDLHQLLHSNYHEFKDGGHFVHPTIPRILYQLEGSIQCLTAMEAGQAAHCGNLSLFCFVF